MAGYIRISRSLLDWEWYDDANTFRVFMHLLLNASYEDKKYHGIDVKKGSLVTGRHQLAEELGISERNVRTALNHLKSTNEVTIKATSKYSIITLCKFDSWQCLEAQGDQQNDQQSDQQPTNNRPASDQQPTTTKEIKEIKKEIKKENNILPPLPPQGEETEKLISKIAEMEERQKVLEEENAKLKAKIENAKKANRDLDLSIVSEKMMPVVEEWLAYKRQKQQSYKPQGFVKFYNKLMKDCSGSVAVAKEMVDFSIANNYDGLFKPKGSYRRNELPGQVMRGEEREYNEQNFFEG